MSGGRELLTASRGCKTERRPVVHPAELLFRSTSPPTVVHLAIPVAPMIAVVATANEAQGEQHQCEK